MIPCLMVCQILVCLVVGGQTDKVYTGSQEDNGATSGIQADESENQVHVGVELTSVRAFVPARICHITLSKNFGTFSPPVFFGKIDVNLWCNWTIVGAPGKHIVIYIDGFLKNTNCDDNHDEIIFEQISSSVETTIVSACWNKPTYVFAAQALSVNVVLLWRTFSHTGSRKYFEGRYYIFDDPATGLNAHSCNCSLEPYKLITETAVATVPKGLQTDARPVLSTLPPPLSTSKLPNIISEIFKVDQEHEDATATSKQPLHVAHDLTAGTLAIESLKDVTSKRVQVPFPPSEALQPSPSQSSVSKEDKHTDRETSGDLQTSYVAQWKLTSPSEWMLGKTISLSDSLKDVTSTVVQVPSPSPDVLQPSPSHFSVMNEDKHTDGETTGDLQPSYVAQGKPTSPSKWILGKTMSLSETPRLSKEHSETQVTPYSATLRTLYTAGLPKTPQLGESYTKLDLKQQLDLTNNIQGTMGTHFSAALTKTHNFSKGQFIMAAVTPLVSATHQTELPQKYVTSIVKRTNLPKTSHINTDQITKTSKTILDLYIESHLEKPTPVTPLREQKPSVPAGTTAAERVFAADRQTEILTKPPLILPVGFTSLPERKISGSQGGSSGLEPPAILPATKILSKDLRNQTSSEPQEKSQVLQPVSFSPIHHEFDLQKAKTASHVLDFQINIFGSSYSTRLPPAIETVSGSSPKDEVFPGQEEIPKDVSASSQPKFAVQPKSFEGSLQITELENEMEIKRKNISKVTENQTLPTKEYKSSELFTKVIGWISPWLVNHSLHDLGRKIKTTTQPVTSAAMPYKSSSPPTLISFPLPLPHPPTDNLHPSPDVAVIKRTRMTTAGQDESSLQSKTSLSKRQPGSDVFDISGNQTDLGFPHHPGDSLFKIVAEIQHQHVQLKEWEMELVEVVKAKITEKMRYIPSRLNSLIIKDVTLTNPNQLTLTFWLHLQLGGKGMGRFVSTQLNALAGQIIGTVDATLVSLSVEDVNECQLGIQNCDVKAECANEFGSYSCQCMDGNEDHSPSAPGTVCIAPQPAEIYTLSDQMEILVACLGGVAISLLLVILLLCIVQLRRHTKANFSPRDGRRENQDAQSTGALAASQGECGQMLPSLSRHMSPRHRKEQHTARVTSSNLELTNITFEQTAC